MRIIDGRSDVCSSDLAATCPERVMTVVPQLDFQAWRAPRRVVKEEEPFHFIRCGTPFGTKSTVERIVAKLEGTHWMFAGENARRLDVVRMCDTCRVDEVSKAGLDPYAGPDRPARRTTENYLRASERRGDRRGAITTPPGLSASPRNHTG